jgi:hypothetical protein
VVNLNPQNIVQRPERIDVLTQRYKLVRRSRSHHEQTTGEADEKRHLSNNHALGALIRACAGEFADRPLIVRSLLHADNAEAIA